MPAASVTSARIPPETIVVHNDLVFGPHAHTTPAQTATLTTGFDEYFAAKFLDINPDAAKRLRRAAHDLVIFRVKDPLDLLVEIDLAETRPKNLRFMLASDFACKAAHDALIRDVIADFRKSAPEPSTAPEPSATSTPPDPLAPLPPYDPCAPDTAPDYLSAPQLIRLVMLGDQEPDDSELPEDDYQQDPDAPAPPEELPEHDYQQEHDDPELSEDEYQQEYDDLELPPALPPARYQRLGITLADALALQRMYNDPEIIYKETDGGEHPACKARHHALCALVELRAPGTARLMIDEYRAARAREAAHQNGPDSDDDYYDPSNIEDDIDLLPHLADDACSAIAAYLQASGGNDVNVSIHLLELLAKLGQRHPRLRDACRDTFCRQLENYPVNAPDYNGFLVLSLVELHAVEAAPLIERAYASGKTAVYVCGDWEDVQIKLGLKTKRDTPEWTCRDAIRKERGPFAKLLSLAENFRLRAPQDAPAPHAGRNDPCPCGSGKKYKKCCLE